MILESVGMAALWVGGICALLLVVIVFTALTIKADEKQEGLGCLIWIVTLAFIGLTIGFYLKSSYEVSVMKKAQEAQQE